MTLINPYSIPAEIAAISNNLLVISNNISKNANYFRIEKMSDGTEWIKKNGFILRIFQQLFVSHEVQKTKIEKLIGKNISKAISKDTSLFFKEGTNEPSKLYESIQKYNQTIAKTSSNRLTVPSFSLPLLSIPNKLDLSPVDTVVSDNDNLFPDDKPEPDCEPRFFKNREVLKYKDDNKDHGKEAVRIFTSTQRERMLSGIGRVIESAAGVFGCNVTAFQKYHYRSHGETDADIYASPVSPLGPIGELTSYWMGHATLFLSVPLKSTDSKEVASFNVITDPVEGDLNALLYPRQTKFAHPIEEMPAPHIYLLSHNHLDHYSKETVSKLFSQQPVMIVPQGDGERYRELAKSLGFSGDNIHEMNWWDRKKITFTKNSKEYEMTIVATPARHWAGQGPCGGHESTFLGYIIQGHEEGDIYFAGDTARLNDDHVQKLKGFNIRWNFQPGGPDEVRADMESTHQASVDGLWMHFKTMVENHYTFGIPKTEFLQTVAALKTVYMHTMTYKLGNVHLSDTKDSVRNVLEALESDDEAKIAELKSYEKQVYDELLAYTTSLVFEDGETLTNTEIVGLLRETVVVPKIGSRLNLQQPKSEQMASVFDGNFQA